MPDNKNPLATAHHREWTQQAFIGHDDWLAMNIEEKHVDQLRQQIEQIGGTALLSRGEAHITILTPPEFEVLKEKLTMTQINEIAQRMDIQNTKWKPVCIGTWSNNKKTDGKINQTYFIVVESEGLIEIRRAIYAQYVRAGGNVSSFTPHLYQPHITIGYTVQDLHAADGAIKDTRSCVFDMSTPNGEKITKWNQ